jgi:hypothetical protein
VTVCFTGDAGVGKTHLVRRVVAALCGTDVSGACDGTASRRNGVAAWTACGAEGEGSALVLDVDDGGDGEAAPALERLAFTCADLLVVVGREALCNRRYIDRCLALGRSAAAGAAGAAAAEAGTRDRRPMLLVVSNDRPVAECDVCAASAAELWGRDVAHDLEAHYDGVLCIAVPSLRAESTRSRAAHDAAVRTLSVFVASLARRRRRSCGGGGAGAGVRGGGVEAGESEDEAPASSAELHSARDALRDLVRAERRASELRASDALAQAADVLGRALAAMPSPRRLGSGALAEVGAASVARRLLRSRVALLCALRRFDEARAAWVGRPLGGGGVRRVTLRPAGWLPLLPRLLRALNRQRPARVTELLARAWSSALRGGAARTMLGDGDWAPRGVVERRVAALFADALLHPRAASASAALFNEDVIVRFRIAKRMLLALVARLVAAQLRRSSLDAALCCAQPALAQHARRAFDGAARVAAAAVPCIASLDRYVVHFFCLLVFFCLLIYSFVSTSEVWLPEDGRSEAVVCLCPRATHGAAHVASRAVRSAPRGGGGAVASWISLLPAALGGSSASGAPHRATWSGPHQPPSGLALDPENDFSAFLAAVVRHLHAGPDATDSVPNFYRDEGAAEEAEVGAPFVRSFGVFARAPIFAGERVVGRVALSALPRASRPARDADAAVTPPIAGWCASCGAALRTDGAASRPLALRCSGAEEVYDVASSCHIVALRVCGECAAVLAEREGLLE